MRQLSQRMRRTWAVLACLVGLAASHHAAAYALEGVAWAGATASFETTVGGGTQAESTALAAALQNWNDATAFKYVALAGSADPCNASQPNAAAFGATDCGDGFGNGVLAVTTYQYNQNNALSHAGTVFNQGVAFTVYTGPLQSGSTDFKRVAVHELGHALGLDHENNPNIPAIMSPTVGSVELPTADDIAGVQAIYGGTPPPQTTIFSAILPSSRSVQVGATATAFATIINAGTQNANGCFIALGSNIQANFAYQTTGAGNQPTGSPNQPVAIPASGAQSFIISVTPTAVLNATDVAFTMQCSNAPAAPTTTGLNTLLLSASSSPVPDIIALSATANNDGYVHLSNTVGAFAVATVNLGAGAAIIAAPDTGSASLPVTLSICQTVPSTGQCMQTPAASVSTTIAANATPTFAIFVSATSTIASDPANKRIFVRFKAAGVTRGSTSVAVTSAP